MVKQKKMKITNEGINLIKKFEGLRLEAYLCPAGVWTIGYGHTKGVKKGQVITQLEADNLLKEDLSSFEKGVTSLIKSNINQNQFDSLVSFAFNLGLSNLKSSTLLKKENANTKLIQNVTLEELAKLVIDGTPIKRTEKIDMTTEFHGRV